jgi:hypothetical protein
MKRIFAFVLIATFSIATCSVVDAEEGGAGLYIPGAFASAVDITPNLPGFAVATDFVFYHGSFSASRTLPVAGRLVAGLDANVQVRPCQGLRRASYSPSGPIIAEILLVMMASNGR